MPDLKLRMYIGSVAAVSAAGDAYEFEPFALIVPSIDIAANEARAYIFTRWPESEGWSDHCASIGPLPAKTYTALLKGGAEGLVDFGPPTEKQTLFRFHGNDETPAANKRSQTIH